MGMTRPLPLNVVTYATGPHPGHTRMMRSFMNKGRVGPIVLGWGNQHSWRDRTRCLYEWCKSHPARAVMHVDGYDTCCVREIPEEIQFDGHLVFGAERNCWPDTSISDKYPLSPTTYRFLNGGTWIGLTDLYVRLVEMFNMLEDDRIDQEYYARAFLAGNSEIKLDTECNVFHNLYLAEDDWGVAFGEYYVKSTGSKPFVVHGNGKSNIHAVWDSMEI